MAETNKPPETPDRCRLTILDLMLLTFSYALGFGVSRWLSDLATPAPTSLLWLLWPLRSATSDLVLNGVVFGTTIAGPVAVLSQRAMHRRKLRVSAGEWLWFAPVLNYLGMVVMFALSRHFPLELLMVAGFIQLFCCLIGGGVAFYRLRGNWSRVECRWTEIMGCSVNFIVLAAIFYSVRSHPILM
jgi:hypothetical protein